MTKPNMRYNEITVRFEKPRIWDIRGYYAVCGIELDVCMTTYTVDFGGGGGGLGRGNTMCAV